MTDLAPEAAAVEPSTIGGAQAPEPVAEPAAPLSGSDALYSGADTQPAEPAEVAAEPEPEAPAEEPATETPSPIELTLPEGFTADEAALGQFKSIAAESGLNSESAQKLFDLYVSQAQLQAKAWETTLSEWKTEIAADPDIGGDKTPGVVQQIGKALDQYGTPAAREAFNVTGAGWNPAVVKFVYKMAEALSEGTIRPGGQPRTTKLSPAETLYSK